jgi:L-fuculokinase
MITGLNEFHFNTLYKLYWLQKFKHDIFKNMHHWLFMPSIISGFLSGKDFTDVSMLGTSMLCERVTRHPSKKILNAFNIDESIFPFLVETGEKIGEVSKRASEKTGIPEGVPVFAAGHDTQFAIMGSGAGVNEPVLSSGTWEVLMVRTPEVNIGPDTLDKGITTELDAVPGLYNAGIQWLGSRHIEELKQEHFQDVRHRHDVYDIMIEEAERAKSLRGILFRNLLEELAEKARSGLQLLESSCGFKAKSLIVVGGGSKNALWNRIRAEALGIEVYPNFHAETTVLGAAKIIFDSL